MTRAAPVVKHIPRVVFVLMVIADFQAGFILLTNVKINDTCQYMCMLVWDS